jgi:2-succinyl-5-enolpyruvyl-6-hydroxy-3-cyclohexene-1-carboxylate synthase
MPSLPLTEHINLLWSSMIIAELIKNGLDTFFISPGNRNVPLISALAYEKRAIKKICLDERGAAYRALGYTKATCRPGVLVCTSGTAPANYYPAIIEAYREDIPIVILSADRPPELVVSDANQTIIQEGLYGHYCRDCLFLPVPCIDYSLEALLSVINQVISAPSGPVHINCPFRDPLAPGVTEASVPAGILDHARSLYHQDKPYTIYPSPGLNVFDMDEVLNILRQTRRGLITIGRLESKDDLLALEKFLQVLDWPVFCDIASGLKGRVNPDCQIFTFDHPEAVRLVNEYNQDTILQFGSGLVSKYYEASVLPQTKATVIQVSPRSGLRDPAHRVQIRIRSTAAAFINSCDPADLPPREAAGTLLVQQMSALYNVILKIPRDYWSFSGVASAILEAVPEGEGLFLGNSLAIRAFDSVCYPFPKTLNIISNRGVSGIEGNMATAVGYAEASGKRVTAVIGDISFLHDLNSLIMVRHSLVPVIVVIVNNSGGRIFERLPIRDFPEIMEPWMTTPHAMNFHNLAAQFDLPYEKVENPGEFNEEYGKMRGVVRSAILEITLSPSEDLRTFQAIQKVRL